MVPSWLSAFQICTEDYFSELDTYLIQEKNIYHDVVFEKWDEIKPTEGVDLFYQKVKSLYDLDAEHNKSLTGKNRLPEKLICLSYRYTGSSFHFHPLK